MRRTSIALLVALLLAGGAAAQSPSGFSIEYLDRSVDACTDFYQFACGNWLTTHPLPADRSRYDRFNELADRNARIVREHPRSRRDEDIGAHGQRAEDR